MADMLYGGAGLVQIFRLAIESGAYVIKDAAGTGTAAAKTDAILTLEGYIEQTQMTPQSDGSMKGVFDNYDVSPTVITALNVIAKKPAAAGGTAPAAITMEHGVEKGGSSSTTVPDVLYISYGPADGGATKLLMHWGVGSCDLSSGAIVYKNGQWIKPVISINGKNAEYDLDILEALFDERFLKIGVGGIGDQVVPQYSPYERDYLLKAA